MIEYTVVVAEKEEHVTITRHGVKSEVASAGSHFTVQLIEVREHHAIIDVAGKRHVVPFAIIGDEIHFDYGGEIIVAEVTHGARRKRARHAEHSMAAPMPALVTKILVEPGQSVAKGAPLLILEAMKMEHQISAPHDGTIVEIRCKAGEMVQPPDDLIVLERAEKAE